MPGSGQMKILSQWSVFLSSSSRCVSVEATSSTAGVFGEFVHHPAGPRTQAGCRIMHPHSWSSTLSDTFCHHFQLCYADKKSNQQGRGYIFFSFIALTWESAVLKEPCGVLDHWLYWVFFEKWGPFFTHSYRRYTLTIPLTDSWLWQSMKRSANDSEVHHKPGHMKVNARASEGAQHKFHYEFDTFGKSTQVLSCETLMQTRLALHKWKLQKAPCVVNLNCLHTHSAMACTHPRGSLELSVSIISICL